MLLLLALFATTLEGVKSECQGLPLDHPIMVITLECSKLYGQNKLCVADCMGVKMGNLNEKGEWNKDKVEENIASLPEGGTREAFQTVWIKCAKTGRETVNRKLPDCAGFIKMGKCFRKIFHEQCPEWDKMIE